MARTIIKEYCVCKECGFEYANVKEHFCYTVIPPIYKAKYHCPVCKNDGEVNESEVFVKEEQINILTPNPTPDELCLNGDTNNSLATKLEDKPYVVKEPSNEVKVELLINDNLIKCIKLMNFCGVNDLGALQNGLITKEEYDFMHEIFSKIEVDK